MKVEVLENDAGGFIAQVEACANGVVRTLNPRECILVRINNWFGPKWLPFSAPTTKPDEGIAAKNLSCPCSSQIALSLNAISWRRRTRSTWEGNQSMCRCVHLMHVNASCQIYPVTRQLYGIAAIQKSRGEVLY